MKFYFYNFELNFSNSFEASSNVNRPFSIFSILFSYYSLNLNIYSLSVSVVSLSKCTSSCLTFLSLNLETKSSISIEVSGTGADPPTKTF